MTPVKQTLFGGEVGNCFAACVASMFNIGIEDVPNFCTSDDWWNQLQQWLAPRNLAFIELPTDDGAMPAIPMLPDGVLCIACGPGLRGVQHSVVVKYHCGDGKHWYELEHDPHPDNTGLVKTLYLGWFMVIDPAKGVDHNG